MTLDGARSRFDQRMSRFVRELGRRRQLRNELRDADWSVGAGFGLSLLLVTWLGRLSMLVLAQTGGLLQGFRPRHWLWLASELAHDLWVSVAIALVVGGLLRVLPARARIPRVLVAVLGYLLLLGAA